MTDRYENIRKALEMGPTPGPRKWWEHEDFGYCWVNPRDGGLWIAKCDVRNPFDPEQRANAALIAACDPDTIRALLEERDQLAAALEAARAEVDEWKRVAAAQAELHGEAEERAEQLAEGDAWCAECGVKLENVRPGKYQHPTCSQAQPLTDEALLRQALEALLGQRGEPDWHTGKQRENVIAALRERLGEKA